MQFPIHHYTLGRLIKNIYWHLESVSLPILFLLNLILSGSSPAATVVQPYLATSLQNGEFGELLYHSSKEHNYSIAAFITAVTNVIFPPGRGGTAPIVQPGSVGTTPAERPGRSAAAPELQPHVPMNTSLQTGEFINRTM